MIYFRIAVITSLLSVTSTPENNDILATNQGYIMTKGPLSYFALVTSMCSQSHGFQFNEISVAIWFSIKCGTDSSLFLLDELCGV